MGWPWWKKWLAKHVGPQFTEIKTLRSVRPAEHYLAWCPEHGFYEDILHGFVPRQRTECPDCR